MTLSLGKQIFHRMTGSAQIWGAQRLVYVNSGLKEEISLQVVETIKKWKPDYQICLDTREQFLQHFQKELARINPELYGLIKEKRHEIAEILSNGTLSLDFLEDDEYIKQALDEKYKIFAKEHAKVCPKLVERNIKELVEDLDRWTPDYTYCADTEDAFYKYFLEEIENFSPDVVEEFEDNPDLKQKVLSSEAFQKAFKAKYAIFKKEHAKVCPKLVERNIKELVEDLDKWKPDYTRCADTEDDFFKYFLEEIEGFSPDVAEEFEDNPDLKQKVLSSKAFKEAFAEKYKIFAKEHAKVCPKLVERNIKELVEDLDRWTPDYNQRVENEIELEALILEKIDDISPDVAEEFEDNLSLKQKVLASNAFKAAVSRKFLESQNKKNEKLNHTIHTTFALAVGLLTLKKADLETHFENQDHFNAHLLQRASSALENIEDPEVKQAILEKLQPTLNQRFQEWKESRNQINESMYRTAIAQVSSVLMLSNSDLEDETLKDYSTFEQYMSSKTDAVLFSLSEHPEFDSLQNFVDGQIRSLHQELLNHFESQKKNIPPVIVPPTTPTTTDTPTTDQPGNTDTPPETTDNNEDAAPTTNEDIGNDCNESGTDIATDSVSGTDAVDNSSDSAVDDSTSNSSGSVEASQSIDASDSADVDSPAKITKVIKSNLKKLVSTGVLSASAATLINQSINKGLPSKESAKILKTLSANQAVDIDFTTLTSETVISNKGSLKIEESIAKSADQIKALFPLPTELKTFFKENDLFGNQTFYEIIQDIQTKTQEASFKYGDEFNSTWLKKNHSSIYSRLKSQFASLNPDQLFSALFVAWNKPEYRTSVFKRSSFKKREVNLKKSDSNQKNSTAKTAISTSAKNPIKKITPITPIVLSKPNRKVESQEINLGLISEPNFVKPDSFNKAINLTVNSQYSEINSNAFDALNLDQTDEPLALNKPSTFQLEQMIYLLAIQSHNFESFHSLVEKNKELSDEIHKSGLNIKDYFEQIQLNLSELSSENSTQYIEANDSSGENAENSEEIIHRKNHLHLNLLASQSVDLESFIFMVNENENLMTWTKKTNVDLKSFFENFVQSQESIQLLEARGVESENQENFNQAESTETLHQKDSSLDNGMTAALEKIQDQINWKKELNHLPNVVESLLNQSISFAKKWEKIKQNQEFALWLDQLKKDYHLNEIEAFILIKNQFDTPIENHHVSQSSQDEEEEFDLLNRSKGMDHQKKELSSRSLSDQNDEELDDEISLHLASYLEEIVKKVSKNKGFLIYDLPDHLSGNIIVSRKSFDSLNTQIENQPENHVSFLAVNTRLNSEITFKGVGSEKSRIAIHQFLPAT